MNVRTETSRSHEICINDRERETLALILNNYIGLIRPFQPQAPDQTLAVQLHAKLKAAGSK
jgi:hypothetical protein